MCEHGGWSIGKVQPAPYEWRAASFISLPSSFPSRSHCRLPSLPTSSYVCPCDRPARLPPDCMHLSRCGANLEALICEKSVVWADGVRSVLCGARAGRRARRAPRAYHPGTILAGHGRGCDRGRATCSKYHCVERTGGAEVVGGGAAAELELVPVSGQPADGGRAVLEAKPRNTYHAARPPRPRPRNRRAPASSAVLSWHCGAPGGGGGGGRRRHHEWGEGGKAVVNTQAQTAESNGPGAPQSIDLPRFHRSGVAGEPAPARLPFRRRRPFQGSMLDLANVNAQKGVSSVPTDTRSLLRSARTFSGFSAPFPPSRLDPRGFSTSGELVLP